MDIKRVGNNWTIALPERLRRSKGIKEGDYVVLEETDDGILIRTTSEILISEGLTSRKPTLDEIAEVLTRRIGKNQTTDVRKDGVIKLPKSFRRRCGIGEDVVLEETNGGILIQPIVKRGDPKEDAMSRAKTSAFETNRRRH